MRSPLVVATYATLLINSTDSSEVFEGRMFLTAANTGSSFWCGVGGCAVGLVGNPIAQGLLSASVFVKLGGAR